MPSTRGGADGLARWRADLESWAIPEEILANAPSSPWGHDPARFNRRTRQVLAAPSSPTHERIAEALPVGGTLLDVGAGTGAACLPHLGRAGPEGSVIAVDESAVMLAELPGEVETIEGRWPDVAATVPVADVAVCAHVVYNVPDLGPFLQALTTHARRRVVLELTPVHPLSWLNPLWRHFHGLPRPDRPTVEDVLAIAADLGVDGRRADWDPPGSRYDTLEEMAATATKRLCLPASRIPEMTDVLERLDMWPAEPSRFVTLWWDVA